MKAKDVMTHCVVSIAPGASVLEAIARMISHQVSDLGIAALEEELRAVEQLLELHWHDLTTGRESFSFSFGFSFSISFS